MKKTQVIGLLISIVLMAPLAAVHAGELEFKRISCKNNYNTANSYRLFDNLSSEPQSLIVQITRDGCRPSVRAEPLSTFRVFNATVEDTFVTRSRTKNLPSFKMIVPVSFSIYFAASTGTRVSGTFDVRVLFD